MQKKIITKVSNNLKKNIFGPFWAKFFLEKSGSVTHNFIWVSNTFQNLEKLKIQFQKNIRPEGRKNKILFYRTLKVATGGSMCVVVFKVFHMDKKQLLPSYE